MNISRLVKNYKTLIKEIGEAIGYDLEGHSMAINVFESHDEWSWNKEDSFNFDRHETGDMEEYPIYTISSTGMKGKNFYMGVLGDYMIFMGYEEDGMWDTAEIYMFHFEGEVNWKTND